MNLVYAVFYGWLFGMLPIATLLVFKFFRPSTQAMAVSVQQLKKWPGMAMFLLALVIFTWPISVPILCFRGDREEEK